MGWGLLVIDYWLLIIDYWFLVIGIFLLFIEKNNLFRVASQ